MKRIIAKQNQAGFTLLEALIVAICVIILVGLVLVLKG
jgi:type II secretory pathway pseudopilin PulG